MRARALGTSLAVVLLAGGCGEDEESKPWARYEAEVSYPEALECDPLDPELCAFPFPSNAYTVADESSPTGLRVNLQPGFMLTARNATSADPAPWNQLDGFTTGGPLLVHFPGASTDGLPGPDDLGTSITAESPTLIVDAETGELMPHFVELDVSTEDTARRALIIRPATRLNDATRYLVAIRGVKGEDGAALEASPAFAALRDGTEFDDASIEARRGLYADIFGRLEEQGVRIADLQLAWDFTTSSRHQNTHELIHMRDEALSLVGADGPSFEIVDDDTMFHPDVAHYLTVEMEVPLYLDDYDPGSTLLIGSDGEPEPDGTVGVEVSVIVPQSATENPARLVQFAHGLLGTPAELEQDHLIAFANDHNYILFCTTSIGLAAEDQIYAANLIGTGNLQDFQRVIDRQSQAMVNLWLAMRMMRAGFAELPEYAAMVDPSEPYFYGLSYGGILGGVYMATTTEVERGTLGVPGMPFSILLNRSKGFQPFFDIATASYEDPRDLQMMILLIQMLWERVSPNGYVPYLAEGAEPLPGNSGRRILIQSGYADHFITSLGTQFMARTLGAAHIDSGIREFWGLELVAGHALIEFEFGHPEPPAGNVPAEDCIDPHGLVRRRPEARQMIDTFFRTGVMENPCPGGVCSFPEDGGCE